MRKQGGRAKAEVERLPEWQIVNDVVAASLSRHTRQIYRSSQHKFEEWCSERQVNPLPAQPQTVAMFLASEVRAGIKPATLVRHLAAIRRAHLDSNETDPTSAEVVRKALRGARRVLGTAPVRKRALTVEQLRAMARALPKTRAGIRDRAIILLDFAAALRRSSLRSGSKTSISLSTGCVLISDARKRIRRRRARACLFREARRCARYERSRTG